MSALTFDLEIEQGIPYEMVFVVKNPDGSLKDLTGFSARMQFRVSYSAASASLEATTLNSKLVINTLNSTCKISLTESDTQSLTYSKYVYDLELVDSTSKPTRLVMGKVTISPEVTK